MLSFVVAMTLVGGWGIHVLHRRNESLLEVRDSLERVQLEISRMNAAEWRAIARKGLDAELAKELVEGEETLEHEFAKLAVRRLVAFPGLGEVVEKYRDYIRVAKVEFALLSEGKLEEAEEQDRRQVDPAFEELSESLERAVRGYRTSASSTLKEIQRMEFFLVFGLIVGIGWASWLYWRKVGELRLVAAEQVVLEKTNAQLEERVLERTADLERAKQGAEAASEAKSRFLAVMSHELRTPLNGVIGALQLLPRENLSARQGRWVQLARNSADILLRVINDILDFSKVEAGKLELAPVRTDLWEAVRKGAAGYGESAMAKGLRWTLDIAPEVPRHAEIDVDRLGQVLGNLLANAVKFTNTGSVCLRVWHAAEPAARHESLVRFDVVDTGPGIAADDQERLFLPFVQLHGGANRSHGGTGLGLGICKQLVELMGGRIGVASEPGRGSRFWFELPLATTTTLTTAEEKAPTTPARDSDLSVAAPKPFVLLAEDNDINQELAREVLAGAGCECVCVTTGREAVREAATGAYDLVFMDCMMPDLDGFEATRMIRREEARRAGGAPSHRLPIVAMTANALRGDRELCLAAGMDDYLSKPIDPDVIMEMVERWGRRKTPPGSTGGGPEPMVA